MSAAEAGLARSRGGTRTEQLSILEVQRNQARDNVTSAEDAARNTLLSSIASVNDVVINSADDLFVDADEDTPKLILTSSNANLESSVETKRLLIQNIIDRHSVVSNQISIDTISELETMRENWSSLRTSKRPKRCFE